MTKKRLASSKYAEMRSGSRVLHTAVLRDLDYNAENKPCCQPYNETH